MIFHTQEMEQQAVMHTAARMCAAARTAPKTKGRDFIETLVLTGEELEALAECVERLGREEYGETGPVWFVRDADSLRKSQALVLIGARAHHLGVSPCGFCGFSDCGACRRSGGSCAYQ